MNLLYNISFEVLSNTFFFKIKYIFNRVFIRIENKFFLYFFITLILAVLITFVYYKYISRLLKSEERKILNLLKRIFRPIFRRKEKGLTGHDVFTKRQLRKKEERKNRLDIFGHKEKEEKEREVVSPKEKKEEEPVKKKEGIEKGDYVMWPPKPKEDEVFDKLSKLK